MEKKNYWQYFIESITKNYVNFEGRARRTEYWSFNYGVSFFLLLSALQSL